jgi:hypothetical protein
MELLFSGCFQLSAFSLPAALLPLTPKSNMVWQMMELFLRAALLSLCKKIAPRQVAMGLPGFRKAISC